MSASLDPSRRCRGGSCAAVTRRGRCRRRRSSLVEPGRFAAFVGPSGAGKTTLCYLVPRLYEVDRGAVGDGHDVRSLTQASVADAIGMVTQDTYLLHATIADNLRYAKADATDAELEAAARAGASTTGSCRSPTATTPSWGSAVPALRR